MKRLIMVLVAILFGVFGAANAQAVDYQKSLANAKKAWQSIFVPLPDQNIFGSRTVYYRSTQRDHRKGYPVQEIKNHSSKEYVIESYDAKIKKTDSIADALLLEITIVRRLSLFNETMLFQYRLENNKWMLDKVNKPASTFLTELSLDSDLNNHIPVNNILRITDDINPIFPAYRQN